LCRVRRCSICFSMFRRFRLPNKLCSKPGLAGEWRSKKPQNATMPKMPDYPGEMGRDMECLSFVLRGTLGTTGIHTGALWRLEAPKSREKNQLPFEIFATKLAAVGAPLRIGRPKPSRRREHKPTRTQHPPPVPQPEPRIQHPGWGFRLHRVRNHGGDRSGITPWGDTALGVGRRGAAGHNATDPPPNHLKATLNTGNTGNVLNQVCSSGAMKKGASFGIPLEGSTGQPPSVVRGPHTAFLIETRIVGSMGGGGPER